MNDVPTPPTAIARNAADRLTDGFTRIADVSAERIFREPVRVGDRVVITAAAIDIAGGMGTGNGGSREGDGGGGSGGGGRVEGRPVAAIEIGPDGVSVRPIIDFTRIGMTAMLGAFAVWRAIKK